MVSLSSTGTLQKFVPNIFEAKEQDFQAATQHVFRSKLHASSVILPVVP